MTVAPNNRRTEAPSRTRQAFSLSFGQGLTTVLALASGMVMARVLSQVDLATYRQTLLAYQVAVPLLSLGLPYGLYYFLPTEKTRTRGIVVEAMTLMMVMGLLYAIFIAVGGNHFIAKRFSNLAIADTLVHLAPLPIVMLPAGLLASVMVVRNQVNKLTVYNVLTHLALTAGIMAACLYWKTPDSMVLAKVGLSVGMGLLGIRLMLKALPRDDWRPRWRGVRQLVAYSVPLAAATALSTLSLQIDKIIVSSMCSPETFAIYSNGAIEIPLIGILTGSIMAVILPDLRRLAAAHDGPGALVLFRQVATKTAVIMLPAMFFLLASAEPFILTLFSAKYSGSVLPFRMYLLILPMRIVTFGAFLMAFGQTRAVLGRSAAGLAANVVISILLVQRLGYIGAILGTLLSLYVVEGIWNFMTIGRIVNCPWREILPFQALFQLAGISAVACLPVWLLVATGIQMPPLIRLSTNGVVFVAALVGGAWLFRVKIFKHELVLLWAAISPWRRT